MSLSKKIVLLALGNFAFLAFVFLIFIWMQFQQDLQSAFLAPVRERLSTIAREMALELEQTDTTQHGALVARYADEHDIDFFLFLNEGSQLGGPQIVLPDEVAEQLTRQPPERLGGGPFRPPVPGGAGPRGGPPPGAGGQRPPPPPGVRPPPPNGIGPGGPRPFPGSTPFFVSSEGDFPYWIGIRLPIRSIEGAVDLPGTLLAGFGSIWSFALFSDMWIWLGVLAIASLVSVAVWMPLIRGLTHTIHQMEEATATIAGGEFEVRVGTRRRDELGSLATSINRMASRLEAFVVGQKRFLGDIAHELRSPLGRMQIASEIIDRQADMKSSGHVTDMKEDIGLMADLTEQLLAFAQTDLKPDSVELAPVRVVNVVNRAANVEGGGKADIQIDVEPDLMAEAESEYLFRAVSNLIRNSIRYAGDCGPIEVSARADANEILVTVADSGPGVPDDMVDEIFEPFFRVDTSRNRKTGGTGLGLAIVRASVEVCQGSIECSNRKPSGLEVTLRLKAVKS